MCPKLLDEAAELCLLGSLVLPRCGLEGGGAVHEGLRQVLLALQVNVDPVSQTIGCKSIYKNPFESLNTHKINIGHQTYLQRLR